ncbi:hypothetical protein AIOL_004094 [Candidatus Rhodobacter oscarellae]|uniref:Excinuclease ABC subunit B n=1 Tax=Candidatus Rhodobacter oscarellae TaxID=1675527 RepID=A0A0J9H055_9RHOB|nr:hypothetical protein [Candidatus Rhodobacter lobularis]KMW59113.1 hypothetical protein AIOL_004094 [Candidatus Rhodobacter lobularis]
MRLLTALCLAAAPAAHAWDFTADPICTIWHGTDSAEMVVTYDPARAVPYAISVTLADRTWPDTAPYAIRFDGPRGFVISTDRHVLSDDGAAVIASDTGFENVLKGLEANIVASPLLGNMAVAIPLSDAAPAVAKFRDCTVTGLS